MDPIPVSAAIFSLSFPPGSATTAHVAQVLSSTCILLRYIYIEPARCVVLLQSSYYTRIALVDSGSQLTLHSLKTSLVPREYRLPANHSSIEEAVQHDSFRNL
jgi:hypothetical protein